MHSSMNHHRHSQWFLLSGFVTLALETSHDDSGRGRARIRPKRGHLRESPFSSQKISQLIAHEVQEQPER